MNDGTKPGTNGLWIIGGGGAKRKNFDCSRGVIYSSGGPTRLASGVAPAIGLEQHMSTE